MMFWEILSYIAWLGCIGLSTAWFGIESAALAFLASVCIAWMVIVMRRTDQNDDD